MTKAKAWLHAQGHIATAGRGRPPKFSQKDGREIAAVLLEAKQAGVTFSDWPKGKVTVKECAETQTKTVSVKRESTGDFIEPAPYRYDEKQFKALEKGSNRERSMRSACNNCRVSLVVCWCEKPRIVALPPRTGSVEVVIVPKTKD